MWKVLYLLIVVLVIPIVVAVPVTLNPDPIPVNVQVSNKTNFSLIVTNPNTFEIKEITFSEINGAQFPTIDSILANSSRTIIFNFTSGTIETRNSITTIKFKFLTTITDSPQTHNVALLSSGFSPNFKTIKKGDTIIFRNNDTITHTVTTDIFNQNLAAGQTFNFVFNDIRSFNITDTIIGFGMILTVQDNQHQELGVDTNFDKNLTLQITSFIPQGTFKLTGENTSFSMNNNDNFNIIIRLKNEGNQTLSKVHLRDSLGWVGFTENDFDLLKQEDNAVSISIQPIIQNSNETDKTFTTTIFAKAQNSEEISLPLLIFIRKATIITEQNLDSAIDNIKKILENLENQRIKSSNVNVTIPIISVNFTAQDVLNIKRDIAELRRSGELSNDFVKQTIERLEQLLPLIGNIQLGFNDTLKLNTEIVKDAQESDLIRNTVIGIVIILVILVSATFVIYKQLKIMKQEDQEGED